MTGRSFPVSVALALLVVASPARATVIDPFTVSQTVTGPQASGVVASTVLSGAWFGGGVRSLDAGGVLPALSVTGSIGGGTLTLTQSTPGQRFVDLAWARSTPTDLTGGGAFSAFEIDVTSFSGTTSVFFSVFSPGTLVRSQASPRTLTATGPLLVDFSEFDDSPTDLADITSIRRIFIRVQTTGNVVLGPLNTVPEPRLGALLAAGVGALAWRTRRPRARE